MPNIFDGLRKISDDEMIEQIALLEIMNVANISRPIIQRVKKKTIGIINFFGSKIGKSNIIEELEIDEIWTLVDEKKEELKGYTRIELDEKLMNVIMEKIKSEVKELSEDAISVEVIEEAAKLYKQYKYSTPAQKADNIYLKYSEKISEKAKEYLNERTFVDLQETSDDIEEIINNMEEKQKRDFIQSVDIENVTLLNVWKKLTRQHFARLVWLGVKAYGERFTPKEEGLPSFISAEEDEVLKRDEDLRTSQDEILELKKQIELCKDKIESIENNIQKENRLLNNAIIDKDKAEKDIEILHELSIKLEEKKKCEESKLEEIKGNMENAVLEELDILMDNYKNAKFGIIDINNQLSDADFETAYKKGFIEESIKVIENKEKTIKEINDRFEQIKIDTEALIEIYNVKEEEVKRKEEQKRSEVFESWSRFFYNFTFDFIDLTNIVDFSRKELLHIEACLYELHFIKDPMAISMGIIQNKEEKEEYQYIDVSFPDNFKIEIQYKVLGNQEKNVHIVGITTEF